MRIVINPQSPYVKCLCAALLFFFQLINVAAQKKDTLRDYEGKFCRIDYNIWGHAIVDNYVFLDWDGEILYKMYSSSKSRTVLSPELRYYITNCEFYSTDSEVSKLIRPAIFKPFESSEDISVAIGGCKFYFNLNLGNINKTAVSISHSTLRDIYHYGDSRTSARDITKIALVGDTLAANVLLQYADIEFFVDKCYFGSETAHLNFQGNTIRHFSFSNNYLPDFDLTFEKDSIEGTMMIAVPQLNKSANVRRGKVSFEDCYINNTIVFADNDAFAVQVFFKDVIFGPNARLNLDVDTISFSNCYKFASNVLFNTGSRHSKTYINFRNTDITSLNFNYLGQLKIFQPDDADFTTEDLVASYENALSKFKKEGKLDSYRNLDIEYKQYKYRQMGWIGAPFSLVDEIWWNYGYSKWYVFVWTIFFLLIFFAFNTMCWQSIQQVYSIPHEIDGGIKNYYERKKLNVRKYFSIFLYTAFIFFSLKVNFERLKYTSTFFIISFFLQYLTGLLCLFFIVNAVIKL